VCARSLSHFSVPIILRPLNEAIMDVAIGAAKCRGESTGGMPTLGCPGCNGETMAYVEPEP